MTSANIVLIVVSILSSTVLAAVVTAWAVRRKVASEARKTNTDSQSQIIDDLTSEIARLRVRVKDLEDSDTRKTAEITNLRIESTANKIRLMEHGAWDTVAVALMRTHEIDMKSIGDPPPLTDKPRY